MQKSLKAFSFDREKAGQIIKQYIEKSPYSQRQVALMAGMSEDMLSNVLRGQNKEISLERIFKLCIITTHPVCDFIRELLSDEDIDFRAQFEALCPPSSAGSAPPSAESAPPPQKAEAPSSPKALSPDVFSILHADQEEQSKQQRAAFQEYTAHMEAQFRDQIQQLKDSRQITIDQYRDRLAVLRSSSESHIADLKSAHAESMKLMADAHAREFSAVKKENDSLKRWVVRSVIAFSTVFAALIGLITHHL